LTGLAGSQQRRYLEFLAVYQQGAELTSNATTARSTINTLMETKLGPGATTYAGFQSLTPGQKELFPILGRYGLIKAISDLDTEDFPHATIAADAATIDIDSLLEGAYTDNAKWALLFWVELQNQIVQYGESASTIKSYLATLGLPSTIDAVLYNSEFDARLAVAVVRMYQSANWRGTNDPSASEHRITAANLVAYRGDSTWLQNIELRSWLAESEGLSVLYNGTLNKLYGGVIEGGGELAWNQLNRVWTLVTHKIRPELTTTAGWLVGHGWMPDLDIANWTLSEAVSGEGFHLWLEPAANDKDLEIHANFIEGLRFHDWTLDNLGGVASALDIWVEPVGADGSAATRGRNLEIKCQPYLADSTIIFTDITDGSTPPASGLNIYLRVNSSDSKYIDVVANSIGGTTDIDRLDFTLGGLGTLATSATVDFVAGLLQGDSSESAAWNSLDLDVTIQDSADRTIAADTPTVLCTIELDTLEDFAGSGDGSIAWSATTLEDTSGAVAANFIDANYEYNYPSITLDDFHLTIGGLDALEAGSTLTLVAGTMAGETTRTLTWNSGDLEIDIEDTSLKAFVGNVATTVATITIDTVDGIGAVDDADLELSGATIQGENIVGTPTDFSGSLTLRDATFDVAILSPDIDDLDMTISGFGLLSNATLGYTAGLLQGDTDDDVTISALGVITVDIQDSTMRSLTPNSDVTLGTITITDPSNYEEVSSNTIAISSATLGGEDYDAAAFEYGPWLNLIGATFNMVWNDNWSYD